jgi:hypothetical protein
MKKEFSMKNSAKLFGIIAQGSYMRSSLFIALGRYIRNLNIWSYTKYSLNSCKKLNGLTNIVLEYIVF